ncbi:MAG: helix-turn-helix domain-containing protein [Desulfobulbaceae bacterium]|nr:MAG: helix-turn-helix domain-containing protein [Desulfobulbaceae bacterium]
MPNQKPKTALLTPNQKTMLLEIAKSGVALISQRAQVLLLLDDGKSHAQASAETGLTIGQVRYALTRFRKLGEAMFPAFPPEPAAETPVTETVAEKKEKPVKKKKKTKTQKSDKKKADKKKSKEKVEKPKNKKAAKKDKKKSKKKKGRAKKK